MRIMLSLQLNCRVEELDVSCVLFLVFFFPSAVAGSHYHFVSISKSGFKAG